MILEVVGRRSFGPLLLIAGLIMLSLIIGDIPGVPSLVGIFVFLIAGQLLIQRKHLWLPQWLPKRSADQRKLCKALDWLRSPSRFVDKFLRPRLTFFTRSKGAYAISVACIFIALAMPVMEVVPFSANGAGATLTLFGLSIIAHDDILALLAFTIICTHRARGEVLMPPGYLKAEERRLHIRQTLREDHRFRIRVMCGG